MRVRSLFRLLIKLFGLYMFVNILFWSVKTNFISVLFVDFHFVYLYGLLFIAALGVAIFAFLVNRTDVIIDALRLDEGFDDDSINLSALKSIDLIRIAILIIGVYLFAEHLPILLFQLFQGFKTLVPKTIETAMYTQSTQTGLDYPIFIESAFKVLVGYLLFSNYKKVSTFLQGKRI